jgi:hypothetical protein
LKGGGEWEGHQRLGGRLAGRRWRAGGKCRIPLVRRANTRAIPRMSAPTNRNQDHAPPMEAAAAYRCAARGTPDHSALRAKAPIPHSTRRNHSLLPPISLHSTTSFSLMEKSKYPPSAQQKGRTRMSRFESQSAHNGAQSGTPSRRSPHTQQVQWKRALPLFFFLPPGFESRRSRPRAPAGFRPRGRGRSQHHYPIDRTMVRPVLPLFAARQTCLH